MPKVDAFGHENGNCAPFMLDRPRMERAIAELVRFAAGVGLGGGDLIQMLDSGMSMSVGDSENPGGEVKDASPLVSLMSVHDEHRMGRSEIGAAVASAARNKYAPPS
jgi:hypothetical protein